MSLNLIDCPDKRRAFERAMTERRFVRIDATDDLFALMLRNQFANPVPGNSCRPLSPLPVDVVIHSFGWHQRPAFGDWLFTVVFAHPTFPPVPAGGEVPTIDSRLTIDTAPAPVVDPVTVVG